jgi:hypothetical protein
VVGTNPASVHTSRSQCSRVREYPRCAEVDVAGLATKLDAVGKVLESVHPGGALSGYVRFIQLGVRPVLARPAERIALYRFV